MLAEDIWIEQLDEQLARSIQKACEPPHYNITTSESDRHLYAFVRRVTSTEKINYQGMDELLAVAALSRLIHPTSIGNRYCAKVFHFGSAASSIQALQYKGVSPDVFLSAPQRDWLSIEDAETLRRLMPWLSPRKPWHGRIHRAYWNHEYAMRSFYLDQRWILVVSGIEALINIGDQNNCRQFCDRVQQIAGEFGIDFAQHDLQHAYKLRSKVIHAESFLHGLENVVPRTQQRDLYDKLELLLRTVVRRSLLDESFGNAFRDDAAVRARWPLKTTEKR